MKILTYVECQVTRPFQSCFTMQTRQGLAWPSQTLADLMWERIWLYQTRQGVSSALIRGYKLDAEAAGLSLILRLLPSKPYGRSLGRRLYSWKFVDSVIQCF